MRDRPAQPDIEKNPMVEIIGVSKGYAEGRRTAAVLRDLNLTVPYSSLSVIVGRSGSGKSTLMNLIAGLDTPESGTVTVSGINLQNQTAEELAKFRLTHLGLVFQFFNLLPTLSVLDNVSLPAQLAGAGRRAANERAASLLERVGILQVADQLPAQVSGGEMQRAAIARALVNRPKLVLADEPTGNLDEETAGSVLELFLELARSESTTLLVVTHDEKLITGADHRFTLEHGQIRVQT